MQCHQSGPRETFADQATIIVEVAPVHDSPSDALTRAEELVRTDPLAFLRYCRNHYDENFRDYRCTFVKQERIKDKLKPEQWMDVHFREKPFSIYMRWTRNPDLVKRTLYVQGALLENGKEHAWVRPNIPFGDLLLLKQYIRNDIALTQSRRYIDQFGFRNSLDLIIEYSEKAWQNGDLELTYDGDVMINDRPAYVLKRFLPYDGDSEASQTERPYPDRLLITYIDKEWLVPTCCLSYADDDATELLGKYVLKDVTMNPGLTDANFDREAIDF